MVFKRTYTDARAVKGFAELEDKKLIKTLVDVNELLKAFNFIKALKSMDFEKVEIALYEENCPLIIKIPELNFGLVLAPKVD